MLEIIKEIHSAFDTAQDRILLEAKRIIERPHVELTIRAERVNKLGFTASKPSSIGQKVVDRFTASKEAAENIMYFSHKYPCYKFITEEEVKKICAKYKLVFGDAENYIGDIPEKNITEIERFELKEEDFLEKQNLSMWSGMIDRMMFSPGFSTFVDPWPTRAIEVKKEEKKVEKEKPAFKIVAPLKDFKVDKFTKVEEGYKLVQHIPDPIVLQPVKGGYLIISKWGLEASDELVVNEKMN